MKAQVWTRETLLIDGDEYFASVLSAIAAARESIDVETYIFRDDVTGRRVSRALVEAAARGVHVRLIVDGIGASGWYERHAQTLEERGVHVRVYHPIFFASLVSRLAKDLGLKRSRQNQTRTQSQEPGKKPKRAFISRLNRRDHRKIFLIDGKLAYVGSINITDDHCASVRGKLAWRDTAVCAEGGPIAKLRQAFDAVWLRCHDHRGRRRWRERLRLVERPRRLKPSRLIRLNHTRRLRKRSYEELVHRISTATQRVWLTNAYFAPSGKIARALKAACENGADVRILVPRNSDVFFMPWVATAHYVLVLKHGGRIHEYLPRFLHAKTAVIDQWASVGSSNLNRRSLLNDFEVDLVLIDKNVKQTLADQFQTDLQSAEEVFAARGGITAFLGRVISRLLKNWI